MSELLPGLNLTEPEFREKVHEMYKLIYASNCYGPNPPPRDTMMQAAIHAITYEYGGGEDKIVNYINEVMG